MTKMKRIHYCKSLKHTGKPIIVKDMETGVERTTKRVAGYGHWRVVFNNAKGKEKKRGATTILEVWE